MAKRYLLDTNILVYINKGITEPKVAAFLQIVTANEVFISIMAELELLSYKFPSKAALRTMEQLIEDTTVFYLDRAICTQTILIRRKHSIKLPDAIIAATAITHRLTLVTRNTSDFKGIDKLVVVNPFEL
jgi:predicted nucleic acid-binding protein